MAEMYLTLEGLNGHSKLVLREKGSEKIIEAIKVGRSENKHFVEMAEFILENHVGDYESGEIDSTRLEGDEKLFLSIIETLKRGEHIQDLFDKVRRFA